MTQIFTTFACVGCGTVHTRGTGFAIKQPDHPRDSYSLSFTEAVALYERLTS